jgi:hypothetical protein
MGEASLPLAKWCNSVWGTQIPILSISFFLMYSCIAFPSMRYGQEFHDTNRQASHDTQIRLASKNIVHQLFLSFAKEGCDNWTQEHFRLCE